MVKLTLYGDDGELVLGKDAQAISISGGEGALDINSGSTQLMSVSTEASASAPVGERQDLWAKLHNLSSSWPSSGIRWRLRINAATLRQSDVGTLATSLASTLGAGSGLFSVLADGSETQLASIVSSSDVVKTVVDDDGTIYQGLGARSIMDADGDTIVLGQAGSAQLFGNDPAGYFVQAIVIPEFHTEIAPTDAVLKAALEALNGGAAIGRMVDTAPIVDEISDPNNPITWLQVVVDYKMVPAGFNLKSYSSELSYGGDARMKMAVP